MTERDDSGPVTSPVIEAGEYFAIVRGFEYRGQTEFSLFSGYDGFLNPPTATPKLHDRSHDGCLFRAREVCGPLIAAELVAGDKHGHWEYDQIFSLNTMEIEVWPVTQQYADAMLAERAKKKGQ